MTQETNNSKQYKCPYCPCIFFNKADLQKHLNCFGATKEQHEFNYKKNHGRLEHGYSEE